MNIPEEQAKEILAVEHDGLTPLLRSIKFGFLSELVWLVQNGADIETQASGVDPLSYALNEQQFDAFRILLEAKQLRYPNSVDKHEILKTAFRNSQTEALDFILSKFTYSNEFLSTLLGDAMLTDNERNIVLVLEHVKVVDAANIKNFAFSSIAANQNHFLEALLKKGLPANSVNEYRESLLCVALDRKNLQAAQSLLSHGADINMTTDQCVPMRILLGGYKKEEIASLLKNVSVDKQQKINGYPIVNYAIGYSEPDIAQFFIENDYPLNLGDISGTTSLMEASENNQPQLITQLLLKNADTTTVNDSGNTALDIAVKNGYLDIVKILFEKDKSAARNALIAAAKNERLDIVKYFIENNVDANFKEDHGLLAISLASKSTEVASYLYNNLKLDYDPLDILVLATRVNHTAIVKDLIRKDGSLLTKKHPHDPLILQAAYADSLELVKLFVHKGLAVDLPNDEGLTAIALAVANQNADLVKFLLANGADPKQIQNTEYGDGSSLLHIAASNYNSGMLNILLQKGAAVNVSDIYGQTPLHHAAAGKNLENISILMRHGANPNAVDIYRRTPLMLSMMNYAYNSEAVHEYLISRVRDVDHRDIFGQTALFYSVRNGLVEATQMLLKKGAHINIKDIFGRSLADYIPPDYGGIARLLQEAGLTLPPTKFNPSTGTDNYEEVKSALHSDDTEQSRSALALTQDLINNNDPYGFYLLGEYYLSEKQLAQHKDEGLNLLQKAASAGLAKAQHLLGEIYLKGVLVKQDYDKAFDLIKTASDAGEYDQLQLADMIYNKKVTKYPPAQADQFVLDALLRDLPGSKLVMGVVSSGKFGGKKDLAKAASWLRYSIKDEQLSYAYYYLGKIHLEHGDGQYKPSVAAHYLSIAADNDVADAQYQLALLYKSGSGVEKSMQKVTELLKKAAANEHEDAKKLLHSLSVETNS